MFAWLTKLLAPSLRAQRAAPHEPAGEAWRADVGTWLMVPWQ